MDGTAQSRGYFVVLPNSLFTRNDRLNPAQDPRTLPVPPAFCTPDHFWPCVEREKCPPFFLVFFPLSFPKASVELWALVLIQADRYRDQYSSPPSLSFFFFFFVGFLFLLVVVCLFVLFLFLFQVVLSRGRSRFLAASLSDCLVSLLKFSLIYLCLGMGNIVFICLND